MKSRTFSGINCDWTSKLYVAVGRYMDNERYKDDNQRIILVLWSFDE